MSKITGCFVVLVLAVTITACQSGSPKDASPPNAVADGASPPIDSPVSSPESRFVDGFDTPKLLESWQWTGPKSPRLVTGKGELVLRGEKKKNPFATVIGQATTLRDYVASVDVKVSSRKESTAGLAAYGDAENSIGVILIGKDVVLVRRLGGKDTELARWLLPNDAEGVTLKLQVSGGHTFRFSLKSGTDDRTLGNAISVESLPPWELGLRVALVASNGEARFSNFSIEPAK